MPFLRGTPVAWGRQAVPGAESAGDPCFARSNHRDWRTAPKPCTLLACFRRPQVRQAASAHSLPPGQVFDAWSPAGQQPARYKRIINAPAIDSDVRRKHSEPLEGRWDRVVARSDGVASSRAVDETDRSTLSTERFVGGGSCRGR